jgi:riboflavin synthase
MYTGITRGTFPVVRVQRSPDLLRYAVALDPELLSGLQLGASVSIDGVCQTVVAVEGAHVVFEAIRETLERTTLAELEHSALVSVERSARLGDEVGGHELAGHVIGTGRIAAVHRSGDVHRLRITVPAAWMKYILPKGFIAVNGSSLTVGETQPDGSFEVHLIPETLRRTRLGNKQPGDRVNIELDARTLAIVDTVERVLSAREQPRRVD